MTSLLPLLLATLLLPRTATALHPYGHAFSRPTDFTDAQISAVASHFEVFTVEKASGADKYGPHNSTAATVGTARRIKAVNGSVKVLMYWNAAIHFNLYECEREVQASWVVPGAGRHTQPYYNYSVPAFRAWWVQCAVDAVVDSKGAIDGLFLDATPKVAAGQCGASGPEAQLRWGAMHMATTAVRTYAYLSVARGARPCKWAATTVISGRQTTARCLVVMGGNCSP